MTVPDFVSDKRISCLVGEHPKPFDNFREIIYAPMALIESQSRKINC